MEKINEVIKKLERINKTYKTIEKEICKDVAEELKTEIEKNYASSIVKEENSDRSTTIETTENGYMVKTTGSQVLYTEFGTGTEGEANSHPDKGKYNLNPYNSGKTIRKNTSANSKATEEGIPQGDLYWTYTNSNGEKVYTQGVPAGRQVYDATIAVKKKMKEIADRKVGEVLSKL